MNARGPLWVRAILIAPALLLFATPLLDLAPPMLPWVAVIGSGLIVLVVTSLTTPAARVRRQRRRLTLIIMVMVFASTYFVLRGQWSFVDPKGSRHQIGFGTLDFTLTDGVRKWKQSQGARLSALELAGAGGVFRGTTDVTRSWRTSHVYTAGIILIWLFLSSVVLGGIACRGLVDAIRMRHPKRRFRIALSFSGSIRNFVRELEQALCPVLGPGRVFFDEAYVHQTQGVAAAATLRHLYAKEADLVAIILTQHYFDSRWCNQEFEVGAELARHSRERTVLLAREPVELGEKLNGMIYIDISQRNALEVANALLGHLLILRESKKA